MFSRLAPHYDRGNMVTSLGRDKVWRAKAVSMAGTTRESVALDVGTGTADMALILAKQARAVVGVDLSKQMLVEGRHKAEAAGTDGKVVLMQADATSLPFSNEKFDCITMAFALRNVADLDKAVSEVYRVAKPGGRFVCLEFNAPPRGIVGSLYKLYLRFPLRWLGAFATGSRKDWVYLTQSIRAFPTPAGLRDRMKAAGFSQVTIRPLNMGTVSIHVCVK